MKKINIYLILICFGLCLSSCDTDDIKTYQTSDNIYFSWSKHHNLWINNTSQYIDSIGFSFAFKNATVVDTLFQLPISVQGKALDNDRIVNLKVLDQSTAIEGVHFDISDPVIFRAGMSIDSIPITFYRTPEMKNNTYTLAIELLANDDFSVNMKNEVLDDLTEEIRNHTIFQISVNDILTAPEYWYDGYLGTFSSKKMFLMSELLGIATNFYDSPIQSYSEVQYHGLFMQRYLNEKEASGETVYEDDGSKMMMGPYVQ
ncbi:DUF4843 domain-containing protein [Lutibacter sp. A64]|uniref:DUF4843 domain-containing protein n=1 Tax=Lutibacter sp. A64 TaxID=2918526 RepID=UPI001F0630D0|nr:DUF4843 domain-containing protein [Lutibacter sp. A64]UMB52501.1 DUF4843 domain-containing protein [Lutibacter sp. A64]